MCARLYTQQPPDNLGCSTASKMPREWGSAQPGWVMHTGEYCWEQPKESEARGVRVCILNAHTGMHLAHLSIITASHTAEWERQHKALSAPLSLAYPLDLGQATYPQGSIASSLDLGSLISAILKLCLKMALKNGWDERAASPSTAILAVRLMQHLTANNHGSHCP